MNREAQDNLLLLVGVMILLVALTDLHLRYVKPAMQPLLVLSGLVLVGLGALGVLSAYRSMGPEKRAEAEHAAAAVHDGVGEVTGHDGHGHAHHMPRTAWLLALPLLVMALVTPSSLGSYAAERQSSVVEAPTYELPPLPEPVDGAVELTLTDFSGRALYDPKTVAGVRVRLIGFATPAPGGGWTVTRMRLACCAADGRPVKVLVTGPAATPVPERDTWVAVEGRFEPVPSADSELPVVALSADSVRVVPAPAQTYET